MDVVNVGFGNVVAAGRIVAIVKAPSAPVKRLIDWAGTEGMLIDATTGKRMRSVIVMDSHHVILSAISQSTLVARMKGEHVEDDGERE